MGENQPNIDYEVEKTELKKSVGVVSGVALIVGTMIGSGVFISPKGVLEGTGSIGFSLIIWAFCGLLSTLGALAYAELGTSIPRSGGEHAYLMYIFGERSGKMGKLPAFLFDWMALFILRPTMFTVAMLSMGTYTVKPFFPGCTDVPDLPVKLITIAAMLLLAAINIYSVKLATRLQLITTASKLLAITIIAVGGTYQLCVEKTLEISDIFADTKKDASLISTAFYNSLWAYDGWNNLNFITEEIKSPEKNLPRCIMLGIPLTTFAYLIANVGYFAVLTKPEILASPAVAVTWSNYLLGMMSWIMPIFVILSCFGAANGVLFATGRLCFAAARDKNLPSVLSYIQIKRLTPMPSIMFTVVISIFIVLPGDLSTLIDFYGFSVWVWYCITLAALLVLRKTQPGLHRPYKVPIVIPVIVLIIGLYLTISPIIQTGRITFFYAIMFMLSGVIVYFPFIYYNMHINGKDRIYKALQKLLQIVPT
ncbi:b(0,+)-type amino acid transporter 1-like [Mercenaria mercenaria]|uniref:b(0,+)-type amino acid transporter 1-like n=1 Tax=Mercenaria mercenaria TaxID=6596 RepID=UPI00234F263A|nr:b(0,+)-type amino acid transporter 1-like [Mercenaria mercenaria]